MIAQDFLIIADHLMSSQDSRSEASLRTIVGRSYYTVYLSTRDWIDTRFPDVLASAEGNSHEKYGDCLRKLQRMHMDLSFSKFARQLGELKNKRKFADYHIKDEEVQDLISTQEALLQAKSLIAELETLKAKYP
ncbi:hypothetical protein [Acinetobacter johnsonii]|uniref:hypothetical protein n=1 Tax=Acinetobacter johnsonii TaxID=40214 RepID=UPI003009264A